MKNVKCKIFVSIVGCFFVLSPLLVEAQDVKPSQSVDFETQSKSAFLFDLQNSKIVLSKNSDEQLPLASLTKLMTALVIYEQQPNWQERVIIEPFDQRNGGMPYFIPGEEVKREELWNLMLTASSNEAAIALARSLGFSEEKFVALMNQRAGRLGLKRIIFRDLTGLDPGNIGSAREVAVLARFVLTIPKIRQGLLRTSFVFHPVGKPARRAVATNQLVADFFKDEFFYPIGGKTGYLEESQYNLVFAAGERGLGGENKKQLIGVVLGNPSSDGRFTEMKNLIYWGFERTK